MLNTLINSTTLGQAIGATFTIDGPGTLTARRLTSGDNCKVQTPIYEKELSQEKLEELRVKGLLNDVPRYNKSIENEVIRVNSLAVLLRELTLIDELDTDEIVTMYVPTQLLRELQSLRIKYYLTSETPSKYYSLVEIELWKLALPLVQKLYFNIVFKDIASCSKNPNNADTVAPELGDEKAMLSLKVRADRNTLYNSMYTLMLGAYKSLKAQRANAVPTKKVSELGGF